MRQYITTYLKPDTRLHRRWQHLIFTQLADDNGIQDFSTPVGMMDKIMNKTIRIVSRLAKKRARIAHSTCYVLKKEFDKC